MAGNEEPREVGADGAVPIPAGSIRFRTVLLRPGSVVPDRIRRTAWFLFVSTVFSTCVCVGAGVLLFPEAAGLIAVCLLSYSLKEELVGVLEENRDVIWAYGESPARANARLTLKLVALFFGMLLGFGTMAVSLSRETAQQALGPQLSRLVGLASSLRGIDFGEPGPLFAHNSVVLLGCFLFAFFFRADGTLLVLGWNASTWGAVYGFVVRAQPSGRGLYALRVLAATAPHIALEAGGYALGALAGIFVSKGMAKYGLETSSFRRVALASAKLSVLGLLAIGAAAYVEAWGTPRLARLLFP